MFAKVIEERKKDGKIQNLNKLYSTLPVETFVVTGLANHVAVSTGSGQEYNSSM